MGSSLVGLKHHHQTLLGHVWQDCNPLKHVSQSHDDTVVAVIYGCRVMDAQYRGRGHPNLFTPDQKALFQDLLKIDLDKFEANHLLTYLGHNGLRRFENTAM